MAYISNEILISFLKKYNVHKLVLSSGTRNIPFVSSVEVDKWFECFSVVDERNAAFFGMGLSQQSGEAVAIACTSGTAVSNYVTGVTEAFYSNVPLIVITFDRSPYVLNQLETQKIDQMSIFDSITKKNICLPIIKDDEDVWYCERLLNEAFISVNQHGTGPIHINIPLVGSTNQLWEKQMLSSRQIKFIEYYSYDTNNWMELAKQLDEKKVLFVLGQDISMSENEKEVLERFLRKSNAVLLKDNLANFHSKNGVNAEKIIKAFDPKTIQSYLPDVVISYGLNFQERIKDLFKANSSYISHWMITPDGMVKDCFKCQSKLLECSLMFFLENMSKYNFAGDKSYLKTWLQLDKLLKIPALPFSSFSVIRDFLKVIPEESLLHLSILNSTRLAQFFDIKPSVKVYSNANSFGIDGCLPTFLGQAYHHEHLAFIIIGDLSFFYAMNALGIRHIKKNVRVMILNNGGGAEFHIVPSHNESKTIDLHIGASHDQSAKGWCESLGYNYLSARTEKEFIERLPSFISEGDTPEVFEIFTDLELDGQTVLSTYRNLESQLKRIIK